ncbi:MAG: hypothetical protein GY926_22420 [bacterium]|nr:hypothetical protein [bacterium]
MLPVPAFDGPLPDELGDIDALVAHWHNSPAVRRRANAIAESTAAVVSPSDLDGGRGLSVVSFPIAWTTVERRLISARFRSLGVVLSGAG